MDAAKRDSDRLAGEVKQLPAEAMFGALDKASDVFNVALDMLDARIALVKKDMPAALTSLTTAADQADKLIYDEPPAWWLPRKPSARSLEK